MKLPRLEDLNVLGKKVLVRADLDTDYRLQTLISTLDYLVKSNTKIILIGHKGRPDGKVVENLSLKPVSKLFAKMLMKELGEEKMKKLDMHVMENLRFNPGEETNDEHFAKHLAENGDVFINEAFAASHRKHASIVGLPKLLPSAAGLHFIKEVENLSRVVNQPKKPVLVIIGGAKKDKLDYVEGFKEFADKILVGGRLPEFMPESTSNDKLIIARLIQDKEDITIRSIEEFGEEIAKAGTIVVVGPMGKFEEEGHRMGTERVFKSIVKSSAFKLAGGGDTRKAISMLGFSDKFDWISVGGGAMLEYLANGTLPGIQALLN
ncbi:MAG: phosphoglycerate kinase [Microgenomates group bacterium]